MSWKEDSIKYFEHLKYKYRFLEGTKSYIDDFELDTTDEFIVTKSWLKCMYDIFNKKYFNNNLPVLLEDKFNIVVESYFRGQTYIEYEVQYITNKLLGYKLYDMDISEYGVHTEKEYCETLLHEMIHINSAVNLKTDIFNTHSGFFETERQRLNSFGWNIPATTDVDTILTKNAVDLIFKSYLVIFVDNDGVFKGFLTNKSNINDIKSFFKYRYIVTLKNKEIVKYFPYIDNFSRNIKDGIPAKPVTKEELNMILDNNVERIEEKKRFEGVDPELVKKIMNLKDLEVIDIINNPDRNSYTIKAKTRG